MKKEIIGKRTLNSKTFDNGNGTFTGEFHAGHIHYSDDSGKLQDINTDVVDKGTHWEMKKAGYKVELPQKSDKPIKFSTGGDDIEFTLTKINGKSCKIKDGVKTEHNRILYSDVVDGVDLELACGYNSFRKELIIKEKPTFVGKFFKIEFETNTVFIKKTKKSFKQGCIHFRDAKAWDNEMFEMTDVELDFQKNRLIKRIPRELLENATYPVRTDTTTGYYAGAGDGSVGNYWGAWTTIHDAATGAAANPTPAKIFVSSQEHGSIANYNYIFRMYFPIDTSGLDDAAVISGAVLKVWKTADALYNTDDDGDDFLVVVQTDQPNPATLTTADYNNCGATDDPDEGSDRIDFGDIGLDQYISWTLNATGLGWIVVDGWTMLGIREGHDVLDHEIAENKLNHAHFYASEQADTGSDPCLDITYTIPPATAVFLSPMSKYQQPL